MSWTDAWTKHTNLFEKYSLTQTLNPPAVSSLILFITEEDRDTIIINSDDLLGRMDHIIAIIINYNQFNPETKHIIDQKILTLQNISMKEKTKFDLIKFSSFAVPQTEILAIFAEINFDITHSEVLIDITGCPSSFLVSVAELVYDNSHSTVTFSYNVASSYDVDKILQRDDLDAENYESIKTYPGDTTSESEDPKFLIIIIGHENKKSKLIAENVKPKHGLLLNNVFSPRADQTQTAVESLNLHRDFVLQDKFGQFNLVRYDLPVIIQTLQAFCDRYSKEYQMFIAPFGSKIQRLGVILLKYAGYDFTLIDLIPKIIYQEPITEGYEITLYYTFKKFKEN